MHLLREQTGAANGQTFGPGGSHRLLRTERPAGLADGSATAAGRAGRRNLGGRAAQQPQRHRLPVRRLDLFHRPGRTASSRRERSLHFQGVFALDPRRAGPDALRLLADDFEKPNGLAFSPDERTLYVCDTGRYHVRAFDVEADGSLASRLEPRLRAARPGPARRSRRDESRQGRPGLRRRRAGGLGVRAGRPSAGNPSLPARPSNLAWCEPDARGLAITAVDAVYYVRLRVEGVMPPVPAR